jgi:hypothetical protein
MMNEDTVKAVLTAYFAQIGTEVHPTERGEKGPDFHINGDVVEVKGSEFDDEGLARQLVTYAYRDKEVYLALPVDAITAKVLVKLYILGGALKEIRGKSVKLYLVSRVGEFYHVKEFSDVKNLIPEGLAHFKTVASFAQLVDTPLGLKRNTSETVALRVANSLARTIQKVDIAVHQLLIEATNQLPYTKVLKSNVRVPRQRYDEDNEWP